MQTQSPPAPALLPLVFRPRHTACRDRVAPRGAWEAAVAASRAAAVTARTASTRSATTPAGFVRPGAIRFGPPPAGARGSEIEAATSDAGWGAVGNATPTAGA